MDILVACIISFILLAISVHRGLFVGYALIIILFIFIFIALNKGYKLKEILTMGYEGGKKSLNILKIFILIGAITAIWMSSGTIAAIVYYGVKFINHNLFVVSAFIISSFVSFLIGTSFGTAGTVGVALMVIARGSGVNEAVTAGAIISGAYFGDRCSPMSSSASLVSVLTETDIYINIKNMFKTSIIPFIISLIFYTIMSLKYPINNNNISIIKEINSTFAINFSVLIPAFIIILLCVFKVNVKVSMFFSIIASLVLSIFVQNYTIYECIKYVLNGYYINDNVYLSKIIKGGGIISMIKTSFVVFLSSSLSGIFEGTKMLKSVENFMEKANNKFHIFKNMIYTSVVTSIFGCSQALAVILTYMLNKNTYEKNNISKYDLAIDLENSAIVLCALIPWNIALLVPIVNLGSDFKCIPYMFYIYMLPLTHLLSKFIKSNGRLSSI